jgi:hypothetical protein
MNSKYLNEQFFIIIQINLDIQLNSEYLFNLINFFYLFR